MKLRCRWFGHLYLYHKIPIGEVCFCKRCGCDPWGVKQKTIKDRITDGVLSWKLAEDYYDDL